MFKYHKINSIFKRNKKGKFILSEYSTPEFEFLKDAVWTFDEKIDGTNIRVGFDGKNVEFGGRTDRAQIPVQLYNKLIELFTVEKLKEAFPNVTEEFPVTLFGEGYGDKIQKVGKLYIPDGVSFILFDVFIGGFWLYREDIEDIACGLGIDHTTIIGEGTIDEAIELVKGDLRSIINNAPAEGVIIRPKVPLLNRQGKRIITKVKCKDFKEKNND